MLSCSALIAATAAAVAWLRVAARERPVRCCASGFMVRGKQAYLCAESEADAASRAARKNNNRRRRRERFVRRGRERSGLFVVRTIGLRPSKGSKQAGSIMDGLR